MKLIRCALFGLPDDPRLQAIHQAIEQGELAAEVVFERADLIGITPELIRQNGVDQIVLVSPDSTLTAFFKAHFARQTVCVHPSLLPAFPEEQAVEHALRYGVKVSGCTVYRLNGDILAQAVVPVYESDTVSKLEQRILEQECRILPEVLQFLVSCTTNEES
ncbi:MAG: hypothetical protein D6675_00910 [Gemmatimonadetes bacterium]|nr:MAG: hypothetical protein D6675_00910 [Gemmatimonadota bacterium]